MIEERGPERENIVGDRESFKYVHRSTLSCDSITFLLLRQAELAKRGTPIL